MFALAVAMLLSAVATAGDFQIEAEDHSVVEVEYTGMVDYYDVDSWYEIVEYANGRIIVLTINSGGGYAYAGLDLYWAMEAYPKLVTVGGADYGAWSAAAIMWTAGDVRKVEAGGSVYFHAAYCTWDPYPFPNIGCDTSDFQIALIDVLDHAGYNGLMFNFWLNFIQSEHGTDGWIGIENGGWWIFDSTDGWAIPFDPFKIGEKA